MKWVPQAPKALARTGLDTLGTGALSNLNSTGAHTERIARGVHPRTCALSRSSLIRRPLHSRCPAILVRAVPESFARGGTAVEIGVQFSLPSVPDLTETSLDFFCLRGGTRASSKECARGCRQRTAQSRFSISSVHARAVVEHSRAAIGRVDSPLSDTSRKRTPRRPTNHSRRSACMTLCGSSTAAKRRNAPPDRNSPFARPSRKLSNVSAHAGTGGLRRGACGTDVTLIASTDRGAPCFASLRAVTNGAGKSR